MRAVARQSVRRFAGMEPGRPVGGTYYLYRTLRNLDLDGVLERLMEQARERRRPSRSRRSRSASSRTSIESRIDKLKKEIEARDPSGARGRPRRRGHGPHAAQAAPRGRRLHARLPRGDGVAAQGDLPAHPQARRAPGPQAPPRPQGPARLPQHDAPLAVLRRRAGRASSSSTRGPSKPEIFVVADISGSVAAFARFTLHLVYAISEPVLEGAGVRVHRRPRRGHPHVRGRRGHHRGRPPRQHRGRRRVGRRPLRLRPRLRGVPPERTPRRSARRPR